MTKTGCFVNCEWRCTKCHKSGTVRPWAHPGETRNDAARRHSADTRQRCVEGCAYHAAPVSKKRVA